MKAPEDDADAEAAIDEDKFLTLRSHLKLKVERGEAGMRLDQFLAKRCPWRSRTKIEELIQQGQVELTDRAARPGRKVHAGEAILVKLPRPKRELDLHRKGSSDALVIVFEDQDLVVVNKPPDIPVHPGGRLLEDTVITRLHARYRVYGDPERDIVPKLCHRLDLETSGILLVAKSDRVAAEMGRQLRSREPVKEYLALVHGAVPEREFEVDAPIGDHPDSAVSNRVGIVPDGAPSRTGFTVERRFRDFTLLRCRLYTGRRHQIRCHLHHAGWPLVGDKIYGLDESFFLAYYEERLDDAMREQLMLPRQALHAERLVIAHPRTGAPLELNAPLWPDFTALLATLTP